MRAGIGLRIDCPPAIAFSPVSEKMDDPAPGDQLPRPSRLRLLTLDFELEKRKSQESAPMIVANMMADPTEMTRMRGTLCCSPTLGAAGTLELALGAADDEELKEGSDVDDANTLVDAELMLTIDDDVDVTLAEEAEL